MKKIYSLILIFICSLIFIPNDVLATDTLKVSFKTTFASDIKIDDMGSILVMMDDASKKSHNIELTHDKNYNYELSGLINGDVNINMIYVSRDNSGKYEVSYQKNKISNTELEIAIDVKLSAPKESKTTTKVNDAVLGDIFGDKYVDKVTEPLDEMGVEEGYDENNINTNSTTNNSNGTTDNSNESSKGTTTNYNGETDEDIKVNSSRLAEQQKKQEKEEEIEKRNHLYKIILIVIIVILLIAIIFVAIKFANANK